MRTALSIIVATTVLAACASTPNANPHDMSAAQHQAAATDHDRLADTHAAAQYGADASVGVQNCDDRGGCWTSTTNPTEAHQGETKKHRKMAADHRAASQALRDAEARACVGLGDDNRDMSPFGHREDIASVEPLVENVPSGKVQFSKTTGAVITFRARPGMTAQWLQRMVDCHLARNAALGHDVPEMPYCPLVPKNVTARVTATETGFAVAVRSDDSDTAAEVLRRARALLSRNGSSADSAGPRTTFAFFGGGPLPSSGTVSR